MLKIAFIGAQNSETTRLRLLGYQKALTENGIAFDERYVVLGSSFSEIESYTIAKVLLARYPEISAIFAYNDIMALGILSAASDNGYRVPQDISVIGFDDTVAFSLPKLSTIAIPKNEMGRIAANILMSRIQGKAEPPHVFEMPPKLIIRDSTGRVRA
jgi:DNA-binding LacI/PurR family transcriptional regulator